MTRKYIKLWQPKTMSHLVDLSVNICGFHSNFYAVLEGEDQKAAIGGTADLLSSKFKLRKMKQGTEEELGENKRRRGKWGHKLHGRLFG